MTSDPLLKWPMISCLYVGSSLSVLVMAVQQSDGLEIETIFQSLGPSFDAPVLTLVLKCSISFSGNIYS